MKKLFLNFIVMSLLLACNGSREDRKIAVEPKKIKESPAANDCVETGTTETESKTGSETDTHKFNIKKIPVQVPIWEISLSLAFPKGLKQPIIQSRESMMCCISP
ncbi:hypothetical protein OOZ15_19725 [Galbibacter sp. EGI 63066]|uniref:hypothetical protein n=1 Tax=Galbibacter sp. EGI 63066 TaxID=2993559 RepID=UPI0022494CC8|nr:hypothetical protein [Galbibacter sp. EGI 63066]MCX2682180.1 hypothetical protein [Galbibacter sp. EGI 63066]